MNENQGKERDMRVLSDANDLECIEVYSDPSRRVHVSVMPKKVSAVRYIHERAEKQRSFFEIVDKIGIVITFLASLGMMFLVVRLNCGF